MNLINKASQRPTALEYARLVMVTVLWLGASMSWAQNYYCDDLGNCSGSGISTYSDSLGNTSGRIGTTGSMFIPIHWETPAAVLAMTA